MAVVTIASQGNFSPRAFLMSDLPEEVHRWSRVCGAFLAWERDQIRQGNRTDKESQEHRDALKSLLRLMRSLHSVLADPDSPNRSLAAEIEGRVLQLESSWEALDQADEKDAAEVMRKAFRSDADQKFINELFSKS
ncbi:MAG TPA: hypothetical protein VLT36_02345 [Candidatus Dormibacteraeota bacterium]|nr:hypothetical protein [Candidatus Dormibacteraeota bacterium]